MTKTQKHQKIAYNFLFTAYINEEAIERTLARLHRCREQLSKYDTDVIYNYIEVNHARYIAHPFIASSYEEIGEKLLSA